MLITHPAQKHSSRQLRFASRETSKYTVAFHTIVLAIEMSSKPSSQPSTETHEDTHEVLDHDEEGKHSDEMAPGCPTKLFLTPVLAMWRRRSRVGALTTERFVFFPMSKPLFNNLPRE